MFTGMTAEEVAAGLDAVAMQLLEAAAVTGPPIDVFQLARAAGLTVAIDAGQRGRARYVRLRGPRGRNWRPTILLRPEPRPERRQWALAHEIGEHVAHRVFHELGIDPRTVLPRAREFVANQMAGRLLLPTPWFGADAAAEDWDLLVLKRRYATASHELIARRMLELPAPAIISIFDQGGAVLSRQQRAGPGAGSVGRRDPLLARGPSLQPAAARRARPDADSRLADPRAGLEARDPPHRSGLGARLDLLAEP